MTHDEPTPRTVSGARSRSEDRVRALAMGLLDGLPPGAELGDVAIVAEVRNTGGRIELAVSDPRPWVVHGLLTFAAATQFPIPLPPPESE